MIAKDLEVCIMHCRESIVKECKQALKDQTLQPSRLYELIGYRPLSAAYNKWYSSMHLPYVVKVDSDTILNPNALEVFYTTFKELDHNIYYTMVGFVEDTLAGRQSGLRICKVDEKLKKIRLSNVIACDRHETHEMFHKHKKKVARMDYPILGVHKSDWNGIDSIVSTFFNTGQKCLMLNDKKMKLFYRLCRKYVKTGDIEPLVAIIAFSHGLFIHREGEKYSGYSDRVKRHIKRLVGKKHKVLYKLNPKEAEQ